MVSFYTMFRFRSSTLANLALVASLHGLAVVGLLRESNQIDLQVSESRPILATLIANQRPAPTISPKPISSQRPVLQPLPQPVATDRTTAAPPQIQTPSAPVQPESQQQVAAELVQPKFDADYLNNPKPPYPSLSRRLGEEGVVLLRVHVTATGMPERIQLAKSSGFERLDEAALQAVSSWKFVPARQGKISVAAWVQVPVSFQLRR